jgi:hypothetical protein
MTIKQLKHSLAGARRAPVVSLAIVAVVVACIDTLGPTTSGSGQRRGNFYAARSPWNTPISPNASIDPDSALMVQTIVEAAQKQGFLIAVGKWSWPLYYADATTELKTIRLTRSWAPARTMTGVPIPSGAEPDPADDGHLVVVNTSTNCEYDFYEAVKQDDGSWSAGWANTIKTTGSGWYEHGSSATGSGAAGAAGLIRPEELQSGVIPHALAFAYPYTKAGGAVLPATESDGRTTITGAIPMGARVRLDPSLDLSSLALKPYELIIAKAMQQYGMFLTDTGGGVALVAQNPQSTQVPYPWGEQVYVYLPQALLPHLRVLTLGPQHKDPTWLESTDCAYFQ